MELLSDSFVNHVVEKYPNPLNELGTFVYYRTYSRWLPELQRREFWQETCRRVVEFNMSLEIEHLKKIGFEIDWEQKRLEAEKLFENMFLTKQFTSGRTLWVGGAKNSLAKKFASANFNCAALVIDTWDDFCDLFYLLMVGTGVGFSAGENLPKIRVNTTLLHSEYHPLPKEQRLEDSELKILPNGFAKIYVGDSKEGWVNALRLYFKMLTDPDYEYIHTIKVSYNSVRPKGERLKTFGGTASGPEALRNMFIGIDRVLKNQIDPYLAPLDVDEKGYAKVRPIHVLDIGNLIGNNVVVGGVRRTAEIFLFDPEDIECLLAKYGINGIWTEEQLAHHRKVGELLGDKKPAWFDTLEIGSIRGNGALNHRRMSNNSVLYYQKPSREFLHLQFELLRMEGEPGFINLEEALRRRPNAKLVNPCAEILLDSKGLCNLTTVNLMAFIQDGKLDLDGLYEAQKLSARIGVRMTLIDLELSKWDEVQKRDRLIGCSLTGVQDAFEQLGMGVEEQNQLLQKLRQIANDEAERYANQLRIPRPLLVTSVKPEGTLSQVAGGVSSGLHWSHSPYYIRRIRINAADPLAQVVRQLGWPIHAEVGTEGATEEEKLKNARTWVIDFPIASGARRTKYDITALEQLETYFRFQKMYTDHNSSITVSVRNHEWGEVEEKIWKDWDDFVGVSFLSLDEHTYDLAPYEAIDELTYYKMKENMVPFSPGLLEAFERSLETQGEDFDIGNDGCENGVCPVR